MVKRQFLGILIFPILNQYLKNESKTVLAFKILDTEKVTFLKGTKKMVFVFRIFSRGPMALKTCGKDALKNFCFFIKTKFWYHNF